MNIIEVNNLKKTFDEKLLFENLSFTIKEQTFTGIFGPSGCGKSTLLNILGLLERQDKGILRLYGEENIPIISSKAKKMLRYKIGYIFQNYALCDNDSVEYNLRLAMMYVKEKEKKEMIKRALRTVDLENYENKKVRSLSGGEQQRVAIARVLCKPCDLILADEPTGNLDYENAIKIMELLQKLVKKYGKTVICVSHDKNMNHFCDQRIELGKYRHY